MAAIWSGTPLGIPLHPVQAYAALAFFTIAALLLTWLPLERRRGDVAGLWLLGAGMTIYFTEFWRDPEGRGSLLHGAIDSPQIAAVAMVLAGALVLRERGRIAPPAQPSRRWKTPRKPAKDGALHEHTARDRSACGSEGATA